MGCNKSDIKRDGWVGKFFPEPFRSYAYLARLDRPVGYWLLFFPCLWSILLASSAGLQTISMIALFFIGSVLMRSAGCVINDIWDRDIDCKIERTRGRPIACGDISVKQAVYFLLLLLLLSLIILLQFNKFTIILGFCSLALVVVYPLMKRWTWWPQLFLGFTFNFGILMGWSAITGGLTIVPILLYIAAVFWTLGYDTIYAFQDKDDDELIGVRSSSRFLGVNAKPWITVFYTITISLMLLAGIFMNSGVWYYLFVLLAWFHTIWQVIYLDINNSSRCLMIFKSNKHFALLIAFACYFS